MPASSIWVHSLRLNSSASRAISAYSVIMSRKSSSPWARYANLGRFRVTTPMEPVRSPEPNRPPVRLRISRRSICNRQHMERTSSGLRSELMKFWK